MMDETKLYGDLTEIFHDVFLRDDLKLSAGMTAKDVPGWDSFKQIEIILALEEKFGIQFHTKELDNLHNVGDLVRTVLSKTTG